MKLAPIIEQFPKFYSDHISSGALEAGLCTFMNYVTNFCIDCGKLVDVFNRKVYDIGNIEKWWRDVYTFEEANTNTKPSVYGLIYADKLLLRWMGKEGLASYLDAREKYYSEFRKSLFENKNFPLR